MNFETKTGRRVPKGWGSEYIWARHPIYSAKLLCFNGKGSKSSFHFHQDKHETWYVLSGVWQLKLYDWTTLTVTTKRLRPGDVVQIPPMLAHQLKCLEDCGTIVEASTQDSSADNYRIAPGDSQRDEARKKKRKRK